MKHSEPWPDRNEYPHTRPCPRCGVKVLDMRTHLLIACEKREKNQTKRGGGNTKKPSSLGAQTF